MGREILFRGKRIDDGQWIEGYYVKHGSRNWIYTGKIQYMYFPACADLPTKYEVEPESIGQYTGLTDKNGKKIFEGDILKNWNGTTYTVMYDNHSGAFCFKNDALLAMFRICGFEIIGNIFDDEELLKQ